MFVKIVLILLLVALNFIHAIPHEETSIQNGFPEGGEMIAPLSFHALKEEAMEEGLEDLAVNAKDVHLKVGAGWYNFTFTNQYSFANRNFLFQTEKQTLLRITDTFCAGDVFQVYDWGQFLLQTTPVNITCDNYTPLPDVAWPSIGWSSGYYFLDPGCHNITIQVIQSPYTAGAANIRVDYEFAHPSKTYH